MKGAILLSLLPGLLIAQEPCAISGTVVDALSGHPIERVKVFAGSFDTFDTGISSPSIRRLTNAEGRFCFERLSAGNYRVRLAKAGYIDTVYGTRHGNGPGLAVAVNASQPLLSPLTLRMTPQAVISGTVTDAEGDPTPFAQIRVRKPSQLKNANFDGTDAEADEEGRFRVWGIAPGTYYLSAQPRTPRQPTRNQINSLDSAGQPIRDKEVETFYKSALAVGSATPITMKAGQELSGLTIVIRKATPKHISGRVSLDGLSQGLPSLILSGEPTGAFNSVSVEKDGSFKIEGLAPGRYSLTADVPSEHSRARKEIDLTERDADGILLQPFTMLIFKLSARIEGSSISLEDAPELLNADGSAGEAGQPNDNGTWTFSSLLPDVYRLDFGSNPNHYFVKRLLIDGELHPGGSIDLEKSQPKLIDVLLALGTGRLAIQITNGQQSVPAATLVVVDETTHELLRQQAAPPGGQLEIKALPPATYRLFACEDFDGKEWDSQEFRSLLAAKSSLVELHDAEGRRVSVALISARETDAASQQSGR